MNGRWAQLYESGTALTPQAQRLLDKMMDRHAAETESRKASGSIWNSSGRAKPTAGVPGADGGAEVGAARLPRFAAGRRTDAAASGAVGRPAPPLRGRTGRRTALRGALCRGLRGSSADALLFRTDLPPHRCARVRPTTISRHPICPVRNSGFRSLSPASGFSCSISGLRGAVPAAVRRRRSFRSMRNMPTAVLRSSESPASATRPMRC